MENFTTKLNFLLNESNEYASSLYNNEIETHHFLYVFFNSDLVEEKKIILNETKLKINELNKLLFDEINLFPKISNVDDNLKISKNFLSIINKAINYSKSVGDEYLSVLTLVYHILKSDTKIKSIFKDIDLGWYKENNQGGTIAGTYIHGIFENDDWRDRYINLIRRSKNLPILDKKTRSYKIKRECIIENLANEFHKHFNISSLLN